MLEESAPARTYWRPIQKTEAYTVVVICAGGGEDHPVSAGCQLSGVKESVDGWAAVVCFQLRGDGVKVAVELESDSVTSLRQIGTSKVIKKAGITQPRHLLR